MDTNTVLLTSFQTFFALDKNPGEDMDTETIWNDIVKTVPTLSDKIEPCLALKKEIAAFFANKEFVEHFTIKYNCTVRELLLIFIKKQFYVFDKYLIKKLMSII